MILFNDTNLLEFPYRNIFIYLLYQQAFDEMMNDLLHLIFPNNCALCGNHLMKQEETICTSCEVNLPFTQLVNLTDNPIQKLFWGKCEIKDAYSLLYFTKGGKVQQLMHEFKYNNNTAIGNKMGEIIAHELSKQSATYDVIIPVPLHPKKEKIRGYNQASFIGKGIANTLNSTFDDKGLKRIQFNESQTKKDRFTRFKNTEDIFKCASKNYFDSKHILLVDDVITTGSTIEACVNTLKKQHDNITISVCSIAVSV